jgi:hypothetical protein
MLIPLAGGKARGLPIGADAQVNRSLGRLMHCLVAFPAKRNQISLDIVTKCATPSQVVNIKILEAATYLTAPVIALQDSFAQPRIRNARQSNSRLFLRDRVVHLVPAGLDGPYAPSEHPLGAEDS